MWIMAPLDRIAERMYRLALEEFHEQVATGYPRLRQIQSIHVSGLLRFVLGLELPKQHALASGLIKRFHTRAVSLTAESPTPEEMALVSELLDFDFILPPGKKGWSRSEMRRLLDSALPAIYGPVRYRWFRGECDFSFELHGYEVRTFLDTHSYASRLSWFHNVNVGGGIELGPTSYLNWLGIVGSVTSWDTAEDELQAINGFVEVSRRFREVLEIALQRS